MAASSDTTTDTDSTTIRANGATGASASANGKTEISKAELEAALEPKWRAPKVAGLITAEHHFARDEGDALYIYEKGVYRAKGERRIKALAKRLIPSSAWSTHLVNETIEYIRADARRLWEAPPLDVLNLENGLLDIKRRKLSAHTPEHLSWVQLPVCYDARARCPGWEKQIKETFPEDAVKAGTAWEIVAWLMLPLKTTQKALLLLGPGGSGKSTFLNALIAFLGGRNNVTGLSMQTLETVRFATARLIGKLANICPDLPSKHLETSDVFKKLTGGDFMIPGEYKFRDSFDFTSFVRLVFSANQPPQSKDASDAFFQRWYVLPFTTVYRGTKRECDQRKLHAKLTTPAELSGVLNRALDVLARVSRSGLTVTQSMRKAFLEFQEVTDPLAVVLAQKTVDSPKDFISCARLLDVCNDALHMNGNPLINRTSLGRELKRLRPKLKEVQRTVDGKPKVNCYLGIALRPEVEWGSRSRFGR